MWDVVDSVRTVFSSLGAALSGLSAVQKVLNLKHALLPRSLRQSGSVEDLILGRWQGRTSGLNSRGQIIFTHEVRWDFERKGRKIVCNSPAFVDEQGSKFQVDYDMTLRHVTDHFFMMEYVNKDRRQLNFGSEVLRISDDGKSFEGRFVGYSPRRKAIIIGRIEATKVVT